MYLLGSTDIELLVVTTRDDNSDIENVHVNEFNGIIFNAWKNVGVK